MINLKNNIAFYIAVPNLCSVMMKMVGRTMIRIIVTMIASGRMRTPVIQEMCETKTKDATIEIVTMITVMVAVMTTDSSRSVIVMSVIAIMTDRGAGIVGRARVMVVCHVKLGLLNSQQDSGHHKM